MRLKVILRAFADAMQRCFAARPRCGKKVDAPIQPRAGCSLFAIAKTIFFLISPKIGAGFRWVSLFPRAGYQAKRQARRAGRRDGRRSRIVIFINC